jgi:hypothetical protein
MIDIISYWLLSFGDCCSIQVIGDDIILSYDQYLIHDYCVANLHLGQAATEYQHYISMSLS